mmetsp:Transcript_125011/g.399693  ORF Transcript_125011/g.399693 Transcript_125011/m.399693 type:complete len:412 (-) Transcript_125011:138-1373(-)
MGVAQGVHELARLQAADLCDHAGQEGVRRDVERNTQSHVARSLVHQAGQLAVGDVELAEHVARRQSHLVQIRRIPRSQQNPPVCRILLDLANALCQLVNPLTCVVGVHVHVLRAEVAPLEAVDRAQVSLLAVGQTPVVQELAGAIAIPDLDALVREVLAVRVTLDEPQQLLQHTAPKDPFGREQREGLSQVEPHHLAKHRDGAHPGAVAHGDTLVDDLPDGIEVLVLLMEELARATSGNERRRGARQLLLLAEALVDHEVVRQLLVALRLADVHHLEEGFVECWEEDIALQVLRHTRDVQAGTAAHLHGLLVRRLAADDEGFANVLAAAQLLDRVGHGGGDKDALGVWRDGCRVARRGARQHDVDTAWQRTELRRDGLPSLAAHDHGVLLSLPRGHCHPLEMRHVAGQLPR